METKLRLNFFIKNAFNSISKNLKGKIPSYFNKKNIFLFLNSALIFSFFNKNSNKILFAKEAKKIPFREKVNVIEYNANNPIEDRFAAVELKNIKGNLLAVFDGHGGDLVSDYVAKHTAQYLDTIYLELTNNKKHKDKTEDQLITQAMYETFQKLVRKFKQIFRLIMINNN